MKIKIDKDKFKKEKFFSKKSTPKEVNKAIVLENENDSSINNTLKEGSVSIKDIIAPSAFDRSSPDYCILDKKYVRSYVLRGYPLTAYVGWLDTLFHYNGDMDVSMHINIANERNAIDSLTKTITQFESQLAIEEAKGSTRHSTFYRNKIKDLVDERAKIEMNIEKLFHAQICCNLYSNSKQDLEKESQSLDNKLRGRGLYLMPLYMRMDEGYKSTSPYGKTYLNQEFRNLNTSALTSCFPFYNPEISHENGIYIGINLYTKTPILVNIFDRKKLFNSNITILGQAGSGKTFFSSLLIMRCAMKGIKTVIIDPEAEYSKLTKTFNGTHMVISSNSKKAFINIFDIEEEDVLDDNDIPTGRKTVNIKEKASEILNLIALMNNGLKTSLTSKVAHILQDVYRKNGINEDPQSLYIQEPYFDEELGMFFHAGVKKKMPRFSDFHNLLIEYGEKENDEELWNLAEALKIYKEGGLFDLFDCYTTKELENIKSSLIITFDISKLEDSLLRKIGMYVALSWTWSQFVKKNIDTKKLVMIDECWMLTNDTINNSNADNKTGGYYSATFLENASRRIRKRNAGLICASQRLSEFAESPQGRAVLTNSFVNIFLKQSSSDIDELQNLFKLSDGERQFLLKASKGEMIIKIDNESTAGYALAFDYEKKIIEKTRKV